MPSATAEGSSDVADPLGMPNGRRLNASGRTTRLLLIQTAERLFAERGVAAVSLREVGLAAGQRNAGVMQYHFGSRENLIGAIYAVRAAEVDVRRRQLLDELGGEGSAEELLRILLQPYVDRLVDPNDHFLGFLAHVLTDEAALDGIVTGPQAGLVAEHMGGFREVRKRLASTSGLTRAAFERRFPILHSWAVHTLAEHSRGHGPPRRVEPMFEELIAMLVAALRAPTKG